MNKYFLLTSFLMFSFTFGFAQTIPWERISPKPIESSLEEIVNVPGTERLIAIGSNATIMHSDNMGESWTINYKPADISRMTDLNAIQFLNSSLGYVVGDNSTFLKTVNGGLSWSIIPVSGEMDFYDVYFLDEQIGFVTKRDTIMKTIDGGLNWEQTGFSSWYHPKRLHFINDTTGFIGNTQSQYYFKTHNTGETWDSVRVLPAIHNFSLTDIVFLDEDTGFVGGAINTMTNSDNLILRTTNGGISWNQVYSHSHNSTKNIYFFDSQKGFAVGTRFYDNMILWTEDGGLSWHESNIPYSFSNLTSISFLENGEGFCIGNNGQILKSDDWGNNWFIQYQWEFHTAKINDAQVVDETTVFIGTETIGGGGVLSGSVFKSTDSGNTWESIFSLWPFSRIQFLNTEFGVAIGPGFGEVYKTIDGGELWETKIINQFHFAPASVYFINEQIGFVGGSENTSVIYKTSDGGDNWVKNNSYVSPFYEINDIAFVDDSNGFAVSFDYDTVFLRTSNQGETWIVDTFDIPIFANKIYFISPEIGFVIGYFKILKTIDGGDTWTEVPHGLDGFCQFTDIEFPTEEVGYITVDFHEESILKSTDGGNTWGAVGFECTSTPTTLAFFSEEEGLVMGKNSIIFKTFSGGIVGVQEFDELPHNNTDLLCFPNPVKDLLNIDLSIETTTKIIAIEFFDSNATLVNRMFVADNQQLIQVDVSGWKNGIYFIVTTFGGKKYKTTKFIKFN